MATSLSDSRLALDQFLLPFDVLDVKGALPDKWDADSTLWAYSKPPIHGWALSWLIHHWQFTGRDKPWQDILTTEELDRVVFPI
jgi:hypothetical protein